MQKKVERQDGTRKEEVEDSKSSYHSRCGQNTSATPLCAEVFSPTFLGSLVGAALRTVVPGG